MSLCVCVCALKSHMFHLCSPLCIFFGSFSNIMMLSKYMHVYIHGVLFTVGLWNPSTETIA